MTMLGANHGITMFHLTRLVRDQIGTTDTDFELFRALIDAPEIPFIVFRKPFARHEIGIFHGN
jgi:hypothetical protein